MRHAAELGDRPTSDVTTFLPQILQCIQGIPRTGPALIAELKRSPREHVEEIAKYFTQDFMEVRGVVSMAERSVSRERRIRVYERLSVC